MTCHMYQCFWANRLAKWFNHLQRILMYWCKKESLKHHHLCYINKCCKNHSIKSNELTISVCFRGGKARNYAILIKMNETSRLYVYSVIQYNNHYLKNLIVISMLVSNIFISSSTHGWMTITLLKPSACQVGMQLIFNIMNHLICGCNLTLTKHQDKTLKAPYGSWYI